MLYTGQLCASLLLCFMLAFNAGADEWGIGIESAFVSEYADRGTTVSGAQIQSNITITNGTFSTGVTYAHTLGDDRLVFDDEIDINVDYSFDLNTAVTLNIGADLIHVPGAGGLFDLGKTDASTIEIYGGVSFDKALSPSLTAIYDVHLGDFTLEAAASHNIDISEHSELSFDIIGGYAAIADSDDNLYLTFGTTYTYTLGENLNAFGSAYAGLSSESTFIDAKFSARRSPIIKTSTSSAWIQIGLTSEF